MTDTTPCIYPVGRSRERILGYGGPGTGKSSAYLSWAQRMDPSTTLWVIDNDNTTSRLLETDFTDLKVREEWVEGELDDTYTEEGGRLVVFHTRTWDQEVHAVEQIVSRAGYEDLWAVDTGTAWWPRVQEWFVEQRYGASFDDWLMTFVVAADREKNGKKVTAAEAQFLDWGFINPQYMALAKHLVNPPCHLYVAAEAKKLDVDNIDATTRDVYGRFHYMPGGQKALGHMTQTVLFFQRNRNNERVLSTVKDRGREELERYEFGESFADGYMIEVAGWRERPASPVGGDRGVMYPAATPSTGPRTPSTPEPATATGASAGTTPVAKKKKRSTEGTGG